ncbi:MAG TPA: hypothetical protein DHV59_18230 [Oxalobacteraceae bacterium]|nr:hypothetical protein [Oxalobacteraceae bacterium]
MNKSLITEIGGETKQEFSARYVRVLRTLSACSRVVIRATDEQALLDEICRTMVTAGGYTHSWVGYALDDEFKTVKPMAKVGFLENNLGIDKVSWAAERPEGQGVFGQSIRSGQPATIRNARESSAFMAAWADATRIYNYNSLLGLPLVVEGKIIGAIGFYSSEANRFDPQEVALLSEVASDLSYGISVIRMRRERDEAQALLEHANQILEQRIASRTAALMAEKERVTYQATHDDLTGLVNRREFESRLQQAVKSAEKEGRRHAFIYMDLDQFKIVNDTCGHFAGDELLRSLAGLLQNRLRSGDTLARFGGDEFGVLLENCPPEPAARIAENLRETASDFRFVWQDNSFTVSLSIGVINFGDNDMSVTDILSAADTACYIAKENGRNRVHVGHRQDRDITIRQGEMHWVGRLQQAMRENRLQLYCQKIVPLDRNAADTGAHFELLLRLRDEEGRLVPPGAFLPAAERFGLMPAIDRWVISSAFANFQHLSPDPEEQLELCAINLSGASISDPEFLSFILRELARHAIPTSKVCFEITETVAIANLSQAITLINELRAVGCKFALDDFGSGMSSFGYLKHLPVDYLKIDGSFVKDMLSDAADAAMVEAINHIGHTMGLRTIAEFVENAEIRARLEALKVDFAQGYGIGKPVPCRNWDNEQLRMPANQN